MALSTKEKDNCEVNELTKALMNVFEKCIAVKNDFSAAVNLLKAFIKRQSKRRIAFELTKTHGQSKFSPNRCDSWVYNDCGDVKSLCCILEKVMKSIKEIGSYEYRVNGLNDARETFKQMMKVLDKMSTRHHTKIISMSLGFSKVISETTLCITEKQRLETIRKTLGFTKVKTVTTDCSENATSLHAFKIRKSKSTNQNPKKVKMQQKPVHNFEADEPKIVETPPLYIVPVPILDKNSVAPNLEKQYTGFFEHSKSSNNEFICAAQTDKTVKVVNMTSVSPNTNTTDTAELKSLNPPNASANFLAVDISDALYNDSELTSINESEKGKHNIATSTVEHMPENNKVSQKDDSNFDAFIKNKISLNADVQNTIAELIRRIDEIEQRTMSPRIGKKRKNFNEDSVSSKRVNLNMAAKKKLFVIAKSSNSTSTVVQLDATTSNSVSANNNNTEVNTETSPANSPKLILTRSQNRETLVEPRELSLKVLAANNNKATDQQQQSPKDDIHVQQLTQNPDPACLLPRLPWQNSNPPISPDQQTFQTTPTSETSKATNSILRPKFWPQQSRNPMSQQLAMPVPTHQEHNHAFQQLLNYAFSINQQTQQRQASLDFHERQVIESLTSLPLGIRTGIQSQRYLEQ